MTDPHSNRPLKGDSLTELSDEDIEARIAGAGRTRAPARPVRGRRTQARQRGMSSRDTFLLLAIVVVASLALKAFWTSQPASAISTPSPRASGGVALGSTAPARTLAPGETLKPGETLGPVAPSLDANSTPAPTQAVPTPSPLPTPTLAPGQTARPTPTPGPTKPGATPVPTTVPATLTVYVVVVNDDGGAATAGQWTEQVVGGSPSPASFVGSPNGTVVKLAPGATYSIIDTGPAGFTKTTTPSCGSTTGGTLLSGHSYTCTITHDDIPAQIIVTVKVVNDSGGSASPGDWQITVIGAANASPSAFAGSSAGTSVTVTANASYDVNDPAGGPSGYALSRSGICNSNGLGPGVTVSCTFTENDVAPIPTGVVPWPLALWVFRRRRRAEDLRP